MPKYKLRDPYDSVKVLRAVFEDILDQLHIEAYGCMLSEGLLDHLTQTAYALCQRVRYKGTSLAKLFYIRAVQNPDLENAVILDIHPANDDGQWILESIGVLIPSKPLPAVFVIPERDKRVITFQTRIVEI